MSTTHHQPPTDGDERDRELRAELELLKADFATLEMGVRLANAQLTHIQTLRAIERAQQRRRWPWS